MRLRAQQSACRAIKATMPQYDVVQAEMGIASEAKAWYRVEAGETDVEE